MEKTQMLNVRVSPIVKQQAEDVLKQLGIPMATAIDMYLRQITHSVSTVLAESPDCAECRHHDG